MEKLSTSFWYVLISIAVIVTVWFIGKNSGKNSVRDEFEKLLKADLKAARKPDAESGRETERIAKKRDFNDLDGLLSELKESDKTEN